MIDGGKMYISVFQPYESEDNELSLVGCFYDLDQADKESKKYLKDFYGKATIFYGELNDVSKGRLVYCIESEQ
jgi:hypothetical protein